MGVGHRASNSIPEERNFAMKFQSSIAVWIFGKRPRQRKRMKTADLIRPRQRWQEDINGRSKKKLKVKNWKEVAKDRRTGRDLAEKEKTHKGL